MERKFISLGSNCIPKLMLSGLGIEQPTLPFDWMITKNEDEVVRLLEEPEWRSVIIDMSQHGTIWEILGNEDPEIPLMPSDLEAFAGLRQSYNEHEISLQDFRRKLQAITRSNCAVRFENHGFVSMHDYFLYNDWEAVAPRYRRRFERLDALIRQPDHELVFIRMKQYDHPEERMLLDWASRLGCPFKFVLLCENTYARWETVSRHAISYHGSFKYTPEDRWILEEALRRLDAAAPDLNQPA